MLLTNLDRIKKDKEEGFTLIELLVVILIVGILSAIAIPAFMNQRKSAADASVQSDLKNAATSYASWRAKGQSNDNEKFKVLANNQINMLVASPNADYISTSPMIRWNEASEMPPMVISNGNFIVITVVDDDKTSIKWNRSHDEGEFCLNATNPASNYNYKSGSGNPANYTQQLFYDSAAGGIKTIDELTSSYNNGDTISCYYYVDQYKEATGK